MPHVAVPGPGGVGRTIAYVLLAALLGLLGLVLFAPSAGAQAGTGGATAGEDTAAAAPGPRIARLRCRTGCTGPRSARPGSALVLRVTPADAVERVVFLGASGDADDVTVAARRVTRRRVYVRVPRFAASGVLSVVDRDGVQSAPSAQFLRVGAPVEEAASSGAPVVDVEVRNPKVFFDGPRGATLAYVVRSAAPASVVVEVLRGRTPVRTWAPVTVEPGVTRTVTWNGTARGRVQRPGRYRFRVTAQDPAGGPATTAQAGGAPGDDEPGAADPEAFVLLDHQFPIRGPHQYGTAAASFGGGRGHQGHDVFAACGTPLVAARGGRVKFKQYHSAAGNYVVLDGRGTETDYAYMHLRDPALVRAGDRVRTGQLLGYVGDTGRATGCHLHFELWSGPGWYDGGAPFDPLPLLRAWDRTS